MFAFLLMILGILCILCSGCALFLSQPPILGEYNYIHARQYTGPVNREIPIWVSKDLGEADKIEISRAVEQWNFVLNGYVHLDIVDTHFDMEISAIKESVKKGGWLIMPIDSKSSLIPIQTKPGLWTLAFVESIGGSHMYLVRERLGNEDVFGVVMHEIGHLLGAPHVGHKLMFNIFTRYRYQCVDYETAKAVAEYQGIAPEDLNYCVDRTVSVTQKPLDVADEVSNCPLESDHR